MKLQIVVDRETDEKIRALVQEASGEVGWWGLIEPMKDGERLTGVWLYDILVPNQKVSGASVDVQETPDAFSVIDELVAQGRQDEIANLRYWGHSHGNMEVFASSTDLKFWDELAQTGEGCAVSAFSVHNKKGSVEAHVFIKADGLGVFRIPAEWEVISYDESATQWAKEQIKDHVTSGFVVGICSYRWDGSKLVKDGKDGKEEDVWDYWPERGKVYGFDGWEYE